MKKIILALLVMGLLFGWTNQAWAPTATATATLSATVPSLFALSLAKGYKAGGVTTSACATPGAVTFDKFDSVDMPSDPNASPGHMYAPYRSKTNMNWHVAKISANGTATLSLKVDVVLTGIDKSKLRVWFGGFWLPGETGITPSKGGHSQDTGAPYYGWEAMGSSKSTTGPFTGEFPFNYQLYVAGVPAGGPYTGTITYTLTQ